MIFKLSAILLLFCLSHTFCIASANNKPNIILILTDNQGYQDLGCFGSPDILTPEIDKMAREGIRLTSFYAASSVCSPSRAALLTGHYPQRVGVSGVFFPNRDTKDQRGVAPEYVTIAEILKDTGYLTMANGT